MTQWIEFTKKNPNGHPTTAAFKLRDMDEEIWFDTKGYAKVDDDVANFVVGAVDPVQNIPEPETKGEPIDSGWLDHYQEITIELPDDEYDQLTANVLTTSETQTGHVWFGQVSSEPSDEEIGAGNLAVYAKDDGRLYRKPHGGSEAMLTGYGV